MCEVPGDSAEVHRGGEETGDIECQEVQGNGNTTGVAPCDDDDEETTDTPAVDPDALKAADELLRVARLRVETAKICAAAQMSDLVESAKDFLARVQRSSNMAGVKRLQPAAAKERAHLEAQIQQRSGVIRVLVRVRPGVPSSAPDRDTHVPPDGNGSRRRSLSSGGTRANEPSEDGAHRRGDNGAGVAQDLDANAVEPQDYDGRKRGVRVVVPSGRRSQTHHFRHFDHVFGPEADQEEVFAEIRPMLPRGGLGCLTGPPQAACIFAYGQTGSSCRGQD